jgi:hypothetical protein
MTTFNDVLAQEISLADAKLLVETALQERGFPIHSSNFELDKLDNYYYPDFFIFAAYHNTATRFAHNGSYAVNRRTAEVWDQGLCRLLATDRVRQLIIKFTNKYKLKRHKFAGFPCDLQTESTTKPSQ